MRDNSLSRFHPGVRGHRPCAFGGATQAADAEHGLEIAANFGLFKARLATAE